MDSMPFSALILQSIPEVIIMLFAGSVLSGLEIKKKRLSGLILIGMLYGLFSYIVRGLPLPFGLHTLLQLPMLLFLVVSLLDIRLKQGIIMISLGVVIQIIIELIYASILSAFLGVAINSIVKNNVLRIIVPWTSMLIMLSIGLFFRAQKITIFPLTGVLNTKLVFGENFLVVLLVLIQAILLGVINGFLILSNSGRSSTTDFIHILSFIILVSLFLTLLLVHKLLNSVRGEITSESLSLFSKNVNDLFFSIRAQRHDFNNHVHTLNGLINIENYGLARDYITKLLKETVQLNDMLTLRDPFLAALFRSKIAYADSQGVALSIKTNTSLNEIKNDSFDLTRICGNLLDNAIEAVIESESEKVVFVEINQRESFNIFQFKNRCTLARDDINSIYMQGYTTKEGHSGLGLSIVQELVKKHNGQFRTDCQDGFITITVKLPKV